MEFTDPAVPTIGPTIDPDLADLLLGTEVNDYDELDAELAAIPGGTATLEVPKRPGYAVRCRTSYTGRDLELLRKRCKDKRFEDNLDGVKLAALLIGSQCDAIMRNGVDLELDGESPVTFASPALQKRMGTTSVAETVLAFYVLEGHVDAAGGRLNREAGWFDTVDALDPTQ